MGYLTILVYRGITDSAIQRYIIMTIILHRRGYDSIKADTVHAMALLMCHTRYI